MGAMDAMELESSQGFAFSLGGSMELSICRKSHSRSPPCRPPCFVCFVCPRPPREVKDGHYLRTRQDRGKRLLWSGGSAKPVAASLTVTNTLGHARRTSFPTAGGRSALRGPRFDHEVSAYGDTDRKRAA